MVVPGERLVNNCEQVHMRLISKACTTPGIPQNKRMRAVVQRVLEASVTVDGRKLAGIGRGLLILLGVEACDDAGDVAWLAPKLAKLRIFADADGKMNRSVAEVDGGVLVVSQFTLHASTLRGNRPSFIRAAAPSISEPLYDAFCAAMETQLGQAIARGSFGADMQVALINDGPVTIWVDTRQRE